MLLEGLRDGLARLVALDRETWTIVWVSVSVSVPAVLAAAAVALPAGLALGLARFRGRGAALALLNTLMALPTVVIGLFLYAVLCRRGALGGLELLYTRWAMFLGQVVLALPLVTGLVAAAAARTPRELLWTAQGLGAGRARVLLVVARARTPALAAAVAAGFGRVFSEVGVSMMLGGNIRWHTRNITTGIAFETGRGEFALGVALGVVLLAVALTLNASVAWLEARR